MNDNLQPTLHIYRHIHASYNYSMNLSLTHWYRQMYWFSPTGSNSRKKIMWYYSLPPANCKLVLDMEQANCIKDNCCIDGTFIYKRKWLYWFYKGTKPESMYLIGEQTHTCQILVNQKTFSILAKKDRWCMSNEMDMKDPSVRK